jgi:hypothetical protein
MVLLNIRVLEWYLICIPASSEDEGFILTKVLQELFAIFA